MSKFWDALGSKGDIKSAEEDSGEDMIKVERKLFRYLSLSPSFINISYTHKLIYHTSFFQE